MNFGEENNQSNEAQAVTDIASTYSDQLVSKIVMAKNTPQVQKVMKDLGLETYVKDVNKEMIKNILTAYGAYTLVMNVKSNLVKVGVAGAAIYLFSQNKEKIQMALNSIIPEEVDPAAPQNIIPIDANSMV